MADLEVFSIQDKLLFKFNILLLHMPGRLTRLLVLGKKDMQDLQVLFRLAEITDVNSSALYPIG